MKSAIIILGSDNEAQRFTLRELCGKSMLETISSHARKAGAEKVVLAGDANIAEGYGDEIIAFSQLEHTLNEEEITLVLKGNMPLLTSHTMELLYQEAEVHGMAVLDKNVGIFCFKNGYDLKNKDQAVKVVSGQNEGLEVSDCVSLYEAEQIYRLQINTELLKQGVQFMDMQSTYIGEDVIIGEGSVIYGNVTIYGHSVIGREVKILPGSWLNNAVLHDHVLIDASKIVDRAVEQGTTVGPVSHLRNHTHIHENVRIGNFVEFKNSNFGDSSKCAHLTYIGDSDVGKDVNIGCGVVTVNYDGKHKFRTTIKDGAFVGSNVNIIAPVTARDKALLAAGSTITEDVADGAMGIARARQNIKAEFGYKYLNKGK